MCSVCAQPFKGPLTLQNIRISIDTNERGGWRRRHACGLLFWQMGGKAGRFSVPADVPDRSRAAGACSEAGLAVCSVCVQPSKGRPLPWRTTEYRVTIDEGTS